MANLISCVSVLSYIKILPSFQKASIAGTTRSLPSGKRSVNRQAVSGSLVNGCKEIKALSSFCN